MDINGNINYKIFVDGSYRSSTKSIGIGIVWIKNNLKVFEYSKGFKGGSNNIAELLAIGYALKSIKKSIDSLEIVSDSKYAIGVLTNPTWKPKKNVELINKIKRQVIKTQQLVKNPIKYKHVRGHQKIDSEDARWNNQCDWLAQTASIGIL